MSKSSLPLQGKVGRPQGRVGRGRSPCGNDDLRAFLKENDLFRLSRNNASIFREIHLPLNRSLRSLGKALTTASAAIPNP